MRQFIRLIIAGVFIIPSVALATTAVVNAADTTTTTSSSTNSTTPVSPTTISDTENASDQGLLSRLATQKAALKLKLTTLEIAHLKLKCKVAQTGAVTNLNTRIDAIGTVRTKVYNDVVTDLNNLVTKLKTKNIDTSQLENQIAMLKTKIATFQTDLNTYKQAVVDLKSLDCQSDPTAFQTALNTARTDHDQVAKDALDIRTYIDSTIKPTLQAIRSQLAGSSSSSSNSSTSTSTGGGQ